MKSCKIPAGSRVFRLTKHAHCRTTASTRVPTHDAKPVCRSSKNDEDDLEAIDGLKERYFESPGGNATDAASPDMLDGVNPIQLGRKARQAFEQIWAEVSALASPTKSFIIDDDLVPGMDMDFEQFRTSDTTVLVVGATGRVGRILCRKLLLRGYKVKGMVRNLDASVLPDAVELVLGDVGEITDCRRAAQGVNKVVYCAAARSTFTVDLARVEERGVMNMAKALHDELLRAARRSGRKYSPQAKKEVADFSRPYHQLRWDITTVGLPGRTTSGPSMDRRLAEDTAVAEITEDDNLIFTGVLRNRGAVAQVGADIREALPGGDSRLGYTEGLCIRLRGDGRLYWCVVKTASGSSYVSRFSTRPGYLTVRLPFSSFRSETAGSPPLVPEDVVHVALRYEHRRQPAATGAGKLTASERSASAVGDLGEGVSGEQAFELEVDWIKALPRGEEPHVVLVSCAGSGAAEAEGEGVDADAAKLLEFKRRGEENLRCSGLGYTIIRPGPLVEEPGGYRALVFDQGDRLTGSISAADVADVCLKALFEPEARNKTFDVCYEARREEDLGMLELVAAVPDKRYNYLQAAVSALAKNT